MTTILLVAEGPSDVRRVRFLIDAWLAEVVDWFDPEFPEAARQWVGLFDGEDWLDIHHVHARFRQAGFPATFGAPFGKGEIPVLKKVRLLLHKRKWWPDVLLWMRDLDTQPGRREQTEDFVSSLNEQDRQRYLLAFANQCGEAWVLAGWAPSNAEQHARTREVLRETGHLLPRDAHRVNHRHTHGGAEWCARKLGIDAGTAEEQALLSGWQRPEDLTGARAFREALTTHRALRSALGLPPAR